MKKKKILIIAVILLVVLVTVLIFRNILERQRELNKQFNSIDDFETVEQVVRYLGSTYIKENESTAEEFSKDIYINFKENLYTGETSNKEYYYKMTDMIAYVLDYDSFRIIDDEKENLIAVICDKENKRITKKYINGDYNYFGNHDSNNNLSQFEQTKTTDIQIQSEELVNLINNNWKSSSVSLGTKTGTFGKYDTYKEGIQARNVYKKVFNIVFKEEYGKPVINGINPGMTNEEVIKILGEPTIKSEYSEVIGYKGEQVYVFFYYGDISVYRVENYESKAFAKLVQGYINGEDVKTFVSGLTDIWPDYDEYEYNEGYVNLIYTLKGIKIQFNVTSNHGVIVYNNYTGEIIEGMTIDNIKQEELKNKVFFVNENTILENEIRRADYYEPNFE